MARSSTSKSSDSSEPEYEGAGPSTSTEGPKRSYPCKLCDRAFTTSGHLSRHMRMHTGERKHVCPYPGCGATCSRGDNLVQHYRVHLSPGSKRNKPAVRAALMEAKEAAHAAESSKRIEEDERAPGVATNSSDSRPGSANKSSHAAPSYFSAPGLNHSLIPSQATILTEMDARASSQPPSLGRDSLPSLATMYDSPSELRTMFSNVSLTGEAVTAGSYYINPMTQLQQGPMLGRILSGMESPHSSDHASRDFFPQTAEDFLRGGWDAGPSFPHEMQSMSAPPQHREPSHSNMHVSQGQHQPTQPTQPQPQQQHIQQTWESASPLHDLEGRFRRDRTYLDDFRNYL